MPQDTSAATDAEDVADPSVSSEHDGPGGFARSLSQRRARLFVVALIVVNTLVVAEVFVRWVAPNLPPPRLGDEQEMFVKVDQMVALADAGAPAEVVFVGASGLDAGIDPVLFDERNESFAGAYNAALVGMPPEFFGRWTTEVVLDTLDPELVVVGVNPQQLSARQGLEAERLWGISTAFDASLDAVDPGALGELDAALSERLALLRYRRQLRNPMGVIRAAGDRLSGAPNRLEGVNDRLTKPREFWEQQVTERGGIRLYEAQPTEAVIDPEGARRMEEWVKGGSRMAVMRSLLQQLSGRVPVVLVVPPTDLETLAASGMDPTIWDQSLAELADVAEDAGVPMLDLTPVRFDPLDFHDKGHLAAPGRERMTVEIAAWVDELCATGELESCGSGG